MRFCGILTRITLCAFLTSSGNIMAASIGGKLELEDYGSFFVNGRSYKSNHPGASLVTGPAGPGSITVNQMYVQYRVPAGRKNVPVVMVHGSGHTGMTYETTPDGREGWATYFLRKSFPVYVVDHAGRGRSGFNPTAVNAVGEKAAEPGTMPTLFLGTIERSWPNFRFGPKYPDAFPNVQFPMEAMAQYLAQLVPNAETTLEGGGRNTVNALVALLDKIGPAVVMVHSQSGVYGLEVVRQRPNLVKAFVTVEGGCETVSTKDIATPFVKVPMISVWGDNSKGAWGVNGDKRREGCVQAVNMINKGGGKATFALLPEMGIAGNSHMMMMDKNNLQVADVIQKWILENAK